MVWIVDKRRKREICARVKQIRIERFGEGRGDQKDMARALGIPYTTYRGYEENRTNDDFLRMFAKKFNLPLLWLMAAETETGPPAKPTPSTVTIDPEKGVINAGKYRVVEIQDDSMHPIVRKGAWVGVVPMDPGKEFQGRLVAIKLPTKKDGIIIRRVVVHGRTIMAIPDNPDASHEPINIHKSDIVGEAVWQFSSLKT
jgi:hypothetical protein